MPEKATLQRAKAKLRSGDAPSTAAGEFVREEMDHIREGKHGARSTKQAIAIGLAKARRAGVPLKPQKKGGTARAKKSEARDYATGQGKRKRKAPSRKRSASAEKALKREPRRAASHKALATQARRSAARRGASARSAAAKKAARTRAKQAR